ncbi:hypothetical protein KC573_01165, partial [candidate division WWE3 bacterium]|nr:hypothetical protein [candidate division WWE3 bacterium]
EQDYTPTCAFMMYSYFLLDTVERKQLIDANNDLIKRSDQLWVFGEVSTGVCEEIKLAKLLNQPIRYFSIEPCINGIKEITPEKVEFEDDVDWDTNNLTD